MIAFQNDVNRKEIPENGNRKEIIDNTSKIINFNKEQKGKELKILAPKQMLPRLTIALAQIKTGNTFENLLNEICQIIYSLYR